VWTRTVEALYRVLYMRLTAVFALVLTPLSFGATLGFEGHSGAEARAYLRTEADYDGVVVFSGSGSAGPNDGVWINFAGATLSSASNSASARYGSVGANASSQTTEWGGDGFDFVRGRSGSSASAYFSDAWTLFGGTGQAKLRVSASCSAAVGPDGGEQASFGLSIGEGDGVGGDYDCFEQRVLAFTWGVPIDVSASVWASAGNGEGYSSYGSAAVSIDQIQPLDSKGNPITRYAYRTESGSPYNFEGGVMAPEPAASALVGIGVLVLAFARRRTMIKRF
jgi:hypothetical protein